MGGAKFYTLAQYLTTYRLVVSLLAPLFASLIAASKFPSRSRTFRRPLPSFKSLTRTTSAPS